MGNDRCFAALSMTESVFQQPPGRPPSLIALFYAFSLSSEFYNILRETEMRCFGLGPRASRGGKEFMSNKHRAVVQKQFTKTLDAFTHTAVRDSPETVAERVAFASPQPGDRVLDVACGPGTLVLALAPLVKLARGIDVTPAMLAHAIEVQRERSIVNAAFDLGDAEKLPYPDGAFSLASCQFAFHHMKRPEGVLKEMLRVTEPAGRLLIVDTIAPEDDKKREVRLRIETLRDPSHTAALRLTDFLKLFDRLGLEVLRQSLKRRSRPFDEWMLRAGISPSDARYRDARQQLEESMPNDGAGFAATRQDGGILINHYEASFVLGKRTD